MATVRHYHHHYHFSYTTSLKRHFSTVIFVSLGLIALSLVGFSFIFPSKEIINLNQISILDLIFASILTLTRLSIAYFVCLLVSIPLALLITLSPRVEKVLLPTFDIIQSIPILAFFPLIVLVFIKLNFYEGAAIFVLIMSMLWALTFSMVGGLKTIPEDVKNAAVVFKVTGFKKLRFITLPSIFPYIVTGSLLSWGAGWNILIVAEVLHTYIPGGSSSQDLFGLGSLLVNATYQGQNAVFIGALICMIILIGLLNFFLWQKLLHKAQIFKYD
jgi:NitT/TauT family transport system permease protein